MIGIVIFNNYPFKKIDPNSEETEGKTGSANEYASQISHKRSIYQDKKSDYYKGQSLYNKSVQIMN